MNTFINKNIYKIKNKKQPKLKSKTKTQKTKNQSQKSPPNFFSNLIYSTQFQIFAYSPKIFSIIFDL